MVFMLFFIMQDYSVYASNNDKERRDEVSKGAKPCSIEDLKRPYVLLNRERLETLKNTIKQPGRIKELYENTVKENAERWVTRDITIPKRAGHYHHFVCTDGVRLIHPENQEIGTTGPYKCPACGKTYTGEKFDAALRRYEHSWLVARSKP